MRTIGFRLLDRRAQLIAFPIIIGTILSAIIPPFQSPDEFAHVKRAYLLSKGPFILCISLFMRAMDRDLATARWMAWLLPVSLLLLVTSRTHLLPLVGIPLVLFVARRRTMDLVLSAVLTILSVAWLYIAMRYTIDLRVTRTHTTGYMIGYYLARPGAFFKLIWASLMDTELRLYYQQTFVGVLGWLDLKFQSWFYQLSILFCVLMGALSMHWKTIRQDWQVRGWLLGFAALSSLLVFFLLLVTWTPHPATVVLGVQGRYFLIPFILVAYALKGQDDALSPRRKLLALPVFYLYVLVLSVVMPQELIYRYFAD